MLFTGYALIKQLVTIIFVMSLVSCRMSRQRDESASDEAKSSGRMSPILAGSVGPSSRKEFESRGKKFVVASQGVFASDAALEMIRSGGNIIDAALAASFVISVERPQSTGLGGGGFLLYREGKTGKVWAVDFRERAPARASAKMFLDSNGDVIKSRSTIGELSVAVPGLVAGLDSIHGKWGQLSWGQILDPAVKLAENGFDIYPHLARAIEQERQNLDVFPASRKIFLNEDSSPKRLGQQLIQKDLAQSLRKIQQTRSRDFYNGVLAKKISGEILKYKGLLTLADLKKYQVQWRKPLRGSYHGFDVISFPPPSSGGAHVIEILNILEKDSIKSMGFASVEAVHLMSSAMQQAFADRAAYMGDPDFVRDIPLNGLLSEPYAEKIRNKIQMDKSKNAAEVQSGDRKFLNLQRKKLVPTESSETTNFSMMDSDGNVVVSTQTINGPFGSKMVIPGTGIVMNNEMDDFSAKSGAQNLYGAIGSEANGIVGGKRPLSSMAPTIVLKDGKVVLALGAPGGTRIITCVAQTIINYLDIGMNLFDSISSVRFHHQWLPDQLSVEPPGFSPKVERKLEALGYRIKKEPLLCRVNAVGQINDELIGVADPRDIGKVSGL